MTKKIAISIFVFVYILYDLCMKCNVNAWCTTGKNVYRMYVIFASLYNDEAQNEFA